MKIKVTSEAYHSLLGRTFDAAINSTGEWCYLYDGDIGYGLHRDQFIIVEPPEQERMPQQTAQQKQLVSLKDLLGYDVARIEFKQQNSTEMIVKFN